MVPLRPEAFPTLILLLLHRPCPSQVCADEDDAQNDKPKGTPGNLVPMSVLYHCRYRYHYHPRVATPAAGKRR